MKKRIRLWWWEGDHEAEVYFDTTCKIPKMKSIIKEVQKMDDYNTDDLEYVIEKEGEKITRVDLINVEHIKF